MRHSIRMTTLVRKNNKEESKLCVFEVYDFENLESELKRQTRLLINDGHRVLDQTITIRQMH